MIQVLCSYHRFSHLFECVLAAPLQIIILFLVSFQFVLPRNVQIVYFKYTVYCSSTRYLCLDSESSRIFVSKLILILFMLYVVYCYYAYFLNFYTSPVYYWQQQFYYLSHSKEYYYCVVYICTGGTSVCYHNNTYNNSCSHCIV